MQNFRPRATARALRIDPTRAALTGCLILALATLGGCTGQDDRIAFDGQYFRAKVKKVDRDHQQIAVEVRPVSASLDGAREAGRFEATKYCIDRFGTSVIDWTIGPDTEAAALPVQNDTLILRGECVF